MLGGVIIRRPPITGALLALVLVLPAASLATHPGGGWQSQLTDQAVEPNTPPDTDTQLQWQAPNDGTHDVDGDGTVDPIADRIYFDTVIDRNAAGAPWPRPDGQNMRGYGTTYWHAYLGYWRDCNADGFFGDGMLGQTVYEDAAGATLARCPAGSPYRTGEFVTEFLPIGPKANKGYEGVPYQDLRDNGVVDVGGGANYVRDDYAKVWHDWGLPLDKPAESRLLLPFPGGTLDDTNGHAQYVDNLVFGRISEDPDVGWIYPVAQDGSGKQCDEDDALNNLLLATDSPGTCSPIPNVPNPVTATARDRYNDSRQAGQDGTPLAKPWRWTNRGDGVPENNGCELQTDVSAWDVNLEQGSLDPTIDYWWRSGVEGCNGEDGAAGPTLGYSNLEFPYNAVGVSAKKVTAQTSMNFARDTHFNPSDAPGVGPDRELCIPDAAIAFTHHCGAYWYSGSNWLRDTQYPHAEGRVFANMMATFYADVNFGIPPELQGHELVEQDHYQVPAGLTASAATALPSGTDDVRAYGDHECGIGGSDTWECDPNVWITNGYEIDQTVDDAEILNYLAYKVGDGFDLRDVECFDNSVGSTSINEEVRDATGGPTGDARRCDSIPATTPIG